MTDKMKVYTKIMQKLKKMMPQNQIVTVAMMVAGIVLGRKAQLSNISLEVPHPAKPASLEKRHGSFLNQRTLTIE